jgi:hypothetical protein
VKKALTLKDVDAIILFVPLMAAHLENSEFSKEKILKKVLKSC